MSQIVLSALPGLPIFKEGDNLEQEFLNSLMKIPIDLQNGDVLVIAQKIISKVEGRIVSLSSVTPSNNAIEISKEVGKDPRLVELILNESQEIVRKRPGLLITRHNNGFISANSGIDSSNVEGSQDDVLLLPIDSDQSAKKIQKTIKELINIDIAILIIDSHGRAWRRGTVGITIGTAGIPGVVDRRGDKDLFGYEMIATEIGVADELAAGASLLMGQVDEGTPVIHVRGFPYSFRPSSLDEILREKNKDLFT